MRLRVKGVLLVWALWCAAPAWAGTVTVAWDRNPPGEGVEGYVVCYGATSRHDTSVAFTGYDHEIYTGAVTSYAQVPDAAPDGGNLYVAVVARNRLGLRSDYSTELTVFSDGDSPGGESSGGGGGGGCFLESIGTP